MLTSSCEKIAQLSQPYNGRAGETFFYVYAMPQSDIIIYFAIIFIVLRIFFSHLLGFCIHEISPHHKFSPI